MVEEEDVPTTILLLPATTEDRGAEVHGQRKKHRMSCLAMALLVWLLLPLCSTSLVTCTTTSLATTSLSGATFSLLHEEAAGETPSSLVAIESSGLGARLAARSAPCISALHLGDVSEAGALLHLDNVGRGETIIMLYHGIKI